MLGCGGILIRPVIALIAVILHVRVVLAALRKPTQCDARDVVHERACPLRGRPHRRSLRVFHPRDLRWIASRSSAHTMHRCA